MLYLCKKTHSKLVKSPGNQYSSSMLQRPFFFCLIFSFWLALGNLSEASFHVHCSLPLLAFPAV